MGHTSYVGAYSIMALYGESNIAFQFCDTTQLIINILLTKAYISETTQTATKTTTITANLHQLQFSI